MFMYSLFVKKYFAGLKKGCIFASAFVQKMGVDNLGLKESDLKRMRRKR